MVESGDLVSIIIPVYNVEKYIAECLESIISQTHKNIEIVVVNDGSNDNSANICKDFAERDSRIKFISQENKGINGARKTGFENSTGDWITFLDSDDFLANDFCEKMIRVCNEENLDILMDEMYSFSKKSEIKEHITEKKTKISNNIREKITWLMTGAPEFEGHPMAPCGKLYARRVIEKVNFSESDYRQNEDEFFTIQTFLNSERLGVVHWKKYFYRISVNDSLSKKISDNIFVPENRKIHFLAFPFEMFEKNRQQLAKFGLNFDEEMTTRFVRVLSHRRRVLFEKGFSNREIDINSRGVSKLSFAIIRNKSLSGEEKNNILRILPKLHPARIFWKSKFIFERLKK